MNAVGFTVRRDDGTYLHFGLVNGWPVAACMSQNLLWPVAWLST